MNEKELIDLIFMLRSDIWENWGYFITVNLAIIGWLLHRHGLFGVWEKAIAFVGYTLFLATMLIGMSKAYSELDSIADDFAYFYIETKQYKIAEDGITEYFISKSPGYCDDYKKESKNTNLKCSSYSSNFYTFVIPGMLGGGLVILILFLFEKIWLKSRAKTKQT
ncbi:MAG: hypothetical protein AB2697_12350 [Candidatus Thiodiazotropha endolucinida]